MGGPCGVEFREAFSCFHYSKSEVKGSECLEQFAKLQMCMKEYPELYEEKNKDGGEAQEEASSEDSKKDEEESTKDSPPSAEPPTAKEEVEKVEENTKTEPSVVLADTEKQAAAS